MNLVIEFTPEAQAALASLQSAPARVMSSLARALDLQNELTIGYAQANKLSGPRPQFLGVRTNRLRGSLRRSDATVQGDQITGAIGSNVVYAAVHEFGFDGEVTVKAFARRNPRGDIRAGKKNKKVASGVSYVKSFTRKMHVPERSFIRSSISDRLQNYNAALSAAVLDALGGSQ